MNKQTLAVEEASTNYQMVAENNRLRKGYKQTEVGVLPEDWEVKELSDLLEQSRSIRYGIVQPGNFTSRGCLMLRSQDYSKGWATPDDMHRVSSLLENQYRNARIRFSDLIMTIVGAGIGQVEVAPFWLDGAILSRSKARIAIDEEKSAHRFIAACIESPVGKRQILNCQKEGAQPVVSCLDMAKFLVPYPPINEQRAIATALSDVDALLAKLDQLITKKRDIKQATMQQLLTGQARLPGFSGEWEIKILGDITQIATGNTPPTRDIENYGDEFMFVSPADLGTNKHILRTEKMLSAKGFSISRPFPKGSILFVCIGSTIGKCGIASELLTSNQQINAIIPSSEVSTDFLYYAVSMVAPKIKSLAGEQAVPIVNKTQFSETEIKLPSTKTEQSAIATILSDMDTEITALESRRDKTRDLKQGMMQELLTGRIRLI